jgi:hypothetical protein
MVVRYSHTDVNNADITGSVSFDVHIGHCDEQHFDTPFADRNRSSAGPEPVPPRAASPEPLGVHDVKHHDGHSRAE